MDFFVWGGKREKRSLFIWVSGFSTFSELSWLLCPLTTASVTSERYLFNFRSLGNRAHLKGYKWIRNKTVDQEWNGWLLGMKRDELGMESGMELGMEQDESWPKNQVQGWGMNWNGDGSWAQMKRLGMEWNGNHEKRGHRGSEIRNKTMWIGKWELTSC